MAACNGGGRHETGRLSTERFLLEAFQIGSLTNYRIGPPKTALTERYILIIIWGPFFSLIP